MNEFLTNQEIGEFTHLIDNYHKSEDAEELFIQSNFANIAGPTGAGKDTIRNLLVEDYPDKYAPVLSTTSRPSRQGEQDGVDYHFRSKDEIRESLQKGEFFEAAVVHNQQVSCLHISEITKLKLGQIGVSILVVEKDLELRRAKPDIKTVFIIPPDLSELKRRMITSRNLSEDEVLRRLQAAKGELQIALGQPEYFCLVNDELEQASESVRGFFEDGQKDEQKDAQARSVIQKILEELIM